MVKIVRYEVYSDKGDGWKLVEQFSSDERQNAYFCAKETEDSGRSVKIIREIYETEDGSFQETVEYVGGLKNKTKAKVKSVEDAIFEDLKGEYNVEATPFKMLAANQVSKAVFKLVLIVLFSLLLANILTSLAVPLVEFMVPDEKRKSVLFFGFFIVFVSLAAPLLFYKVPWNVFYSLRKGEKELINERKIFRRATSLMHNYNLNDDGQEVLVPAFPEAPLEYKEYIIDYLSQILNNLDSNIRLTDSFNRLGVELVVYGGCLELSRYGHLVWAEANSLLYESFKILEGDHVDLSAFYDAKRTYGDNKVAVFLTGVGSYLMAQIINDIPMDASVLKITMQKWIASNTKPETNTEIASSDENEDKELNITFETLANISLNIQIYDDEKEIGEEEHNSVLADIRRLFSRLINKYHGDTVIEENGITSVHFTNLGKAVHFVEETHKEIEDYRETQTEYNLIMDEKIALLEMPSDKEVNLSAYVTDIFEHAYNGDILVNDIIKDELTNAPYDFEFLGDKKLRKSGGSASLYKMLNVQE